MKPEESNPLSPDGFEQRLRRQPLRPLPTEWRAEILKTARAKCEENATLSLRQMATDFLRPLYSALCTPHAALRWGALAAVWVAILTLNHAARDTSPATLAGFTPPSPQMLLVLREQKKMLADLIEPANDTVAAERPKAISPRPRSERQLKTFTV